jgi:alpha-tubulin suppressor-like RCC1 family protein
VWCWGDNNAGQLGDGTTRGANAPRRVRGDTKFKALAAGSDHTCGLSQTGQAFCWGDGFSGQIGRGARESQTEPVPAETDVRFTALAAGGAHTCALTQNGKAYCWGANVAGEIGDGTKSERSRPVAVSGTRAFTAIAAGNEHTCALTQGGDAYCWGRNRDGQLGDGGARSDRPAPVKVAFDGALRGISAGATHTCGVTRDQEVVCWGSNGRGQLGDGTVAGRPTPAAVKAGADRRP